MKTIIVALLITCAFAHPRTPYRLKSSTTTTTEEITSESEDDLATVADVVTEEIVSPTDIEEIHEVTITLSEAECKEVNNIFTGRSKRDALDRIRLKNKFRKACTFAVIAG